jgi:hypothetical protein
MAQEAAMLRIEIERGVSMAHLVVVMPMLDRRVGSER